MAVILAQSIPFDERYFTPGQSLTSENLNKQAALYFSDKRSYVVRGLKLKYKSQTRELTIYPGACVVSNVLVTIKDRMVLTIPQTNITPLLIVVAYNEDKCFNIPPTIQIITSNEYKPQYMCLLGQITFAGLDLSVRVEPSLKLESIPSNNIVTYTFATNIKRFIIDFPYGNCELVNLFLNGTYLTKDLDFFYDPITKYVDLDYNGILANITAEIKQFDGVNMGRSVITSTIVKYFPTDEEIGNNCINFSSIYVDKEILDTMQLHIYMSGLLLFPNLDYIVNYNTERIEFTWDFDAVNNIGIFALSSQYYYDYVPYYSNLIHIEKVLVTTNTVTIPYYVDDYAAVFVDDVMFTQDIDYIISNDGNDIIFFEEILPNSNVIVMNQNDDDITEREIILLTSNTDIIHFQNEPKHLMLIFVDGVLVDNLEFSYDIDYIEKTIKFETILPAGTIITLFIR